MKFADQQNRRRRAGSIAAELSAAERARRIKLQRRNLWLESLEDRSLMATIDLVVNLYENNGGTPGALITTDTVTPGQEFFVEIAAKDSSTTPSGIVGLALDIDFDPTAFEESDDAPFDPDASGSMIITSALPLFRTGTLDNDAGTIDELYGSSNPPSDGSTIGIATSERFALLKFRADSSVANSLLTITIGDSGVTFADGSTFENANIEAQEITVASEALPTLSIDDVTLAEGSNGTFTLYNFTVTLSAESTESIDVQVDTSALTASSGTDYEAITGAVITFAPGELTKTVTVKVNADTTPEPNETFEVKLSAPVNATIADGTGLGTITNDDNLTASITKTLSQAEGNTGSSTAYEFTVSLDGSSAVDVVIPWAFDHGTTTDADFDAGLTKSGKVTIPAGQTSVKIPSFLLSGDLTVELNETFTVTLGAPETAGVALSSDKTGTGTIENDDSATLIITAPAATNEGALASADAEFTVTLSAPVDIDVKFNYQTQDGTAKTAANDYVSVTGNHTFLAGNAGTFKIPVSVLGDNIVELDEQFSVLLDALDAGSRSVTIQTATASATITNDDSATITLTPVSQAEGNSGSANMAFEVTLSNPVEVDVKVDYATADGTATLANSDYTETKGTLTFTAGGALKQTINVPIVGDTAVETDETFSLALSNVQADGRSVAAGTAATGTILDDDDPTPSVSVNDVSVSEGESGETLLTFTVSLSAKSPNPVDLKWSTQDGTALSASDYTAVANQTLTIPADTLSQTITVKVSGDKLVEKNETLKVLLSDITGANAGDIEGIGTITNDDVAVASITKTSTQNEGSTGTKDYDFTVSLDQAADFDVVIPWSFSHVTTNDADFDGSLTKSGKVTIPAGETSIKIPSFKVNGDFNLEETETFTVELGTPEQTEVSLSATDKTGTGTVTNDDDATVSITSQVKLNEGNSGTTDFDFLVSLDNAAGIDVVVPWSFTHTSTNDADFDGTLTKTGKVTIPAGQTSVKISPTFKIVGDTTVEAEEKFLVSLGTPETAGVTLSVTNQVGEGTVENDDVADTIVASITKTLSQLEGNSGTKDYEFTVSLDQASEVDVVIPWTFAHVDSTDDDFAAGLNKTGKITIPAGQTSAKIPAFAVNGDTSVENDETFSVTLGTPEATGVVLSSTDKTATGIIQNDDGLTASITQTVTAAEGNTGTTNLEFTVTLDQNASADVVIPWTFNNVTTTDADFASGLTKTGKVTILAGSTTAKISFAVNGDTTLEGDDTFTVTLGTPETAGVGLSVDKTGTATITNDDQVTVSVTKTNSQTEGNSGTKDFDFTVSLDKAAEVDVVVPWDFTNVTTTDADFTSLTKSGKVTIPAGQTSVKIPSFKVIGDTTVEADETFTVTLSTPETSGAVLSSTDNAGTGTIQNDDQITASITKELKINEGNTGTTAFEFTVTIDQVSAVDVVIPWTFANVTTADSDFSGTLTKSGKITIPAGQTSVKIPSFLANGDTTIEADETFTVTLGTPETAGVALSSTDKIGTGTLLNDDSAVASITKTVTQAEGNSGNTAFEFTVTLDKASPVDVVIPWSFANVTSTDADFATSLSKSGKITIPAGQTSIKIPSFSVLGNNIVEADETFTVTLGTPETAGVTLSATDKIGTGTITNDDTATISIGNMSLLEPGSGTGDLTLPVTLSQPADVDITVTYSFANVTTSDADFSNLTKTGTLTFLAGQTTPTQALTFKVAADSVDEANETFTVTLGDPTFPSGITRSVTTPTATKVGTGTIQSDTKAGSLSGFAYVDSNRNGVRDAGEVGIPGVVISLAGTTTGGASVTLTAMTAADGSYSFTNLMGGKYSLTESQPASMFDGTDVVGTAGGTLTNDKIADIQLDTAEVATGNNFGEIGLLPAFISKRLFLASTPATAQTLRVLNARAAEMAGNQTLADQIANSSIPSVVSANPTTASTASTQSTEESGGEFVAESSNTQSSNNSMSAGEAIDETAAAASAVTKSLAPATTADSSITGNSTSTATKKVATTKLTAKTTSPKSTVGNVTASKISSKRASTIQSLRSTPPEAASVPATSTAAGDQLSLLALDEIMAREKKWR
ncbi:Calx-beta domain-containing protein [Anatilimnocola sp. NA78]|uniref:Calx-beta domain-containing protein n=1 Tax=Anatilimnocola sp. NA78 TaxID=3415683 RepID=UPI003CE44B3B